mmetsp:Transcript_6909/g.42164  ORF Transcript_6909/g.42164 Transcript_6909/m.42164 type:complete len:441 (-) Transcript_6909:298-1620(-)
MEFSDARERAWTPSVQPGSATTGPDDGRIDVRDVLSLFQEDEDETTWRFSENPARIPRSSQPFHRSYSEGDTTKCGSIEAQQTGRAGTKSEKGKKSPRMKRKTKYKGVGFHPLTEKWEAHLKYDGKQVYLGSFNTDLEAAGAHDRAALRFMSSPKLNFSASKYAQLVDADKQLSPQDFITGLRGTSQGCARGKSNFRGVTWRPKSKRWEARIGSGVLGRRYVYLGSFKTGEEAAHTYDLAALICKGKNAVTNYPMSRYKKELLRIESKSVDERRAMERRLLSHKDVRMIIFEDASEPAEQSRPAGSNLACVFNALDDQVNEVPSFQSIEDITHWANSTAMGHSSELPYGPRCYSMPEDWRLPDFAASTRRDVDQVHGGKPKPAPRARPHSAQCPTRGAPLGDSALSSFEQRMKKLDGILSRIFTPPSKLRGQYCEDECIS